MRIQLVPGKVHPDFLDLPWTTTLEEWDSARLAEVARGIGRHVVRFVEYDGALFALKELPQRLAEREYRILRELPREGVPAVEPIGIVFERPGDLDAVLVTRHLAFSLPYRLVLAGRVLPDHWNRLVDALAELLVRLHLAGLFWGDCSLSNALFRRDAGALCAYLVDAETSELHEQLSDGQRGHDLLIAEENLTGELLDLEHELGRRDGPRPGDLGREVRHRYESLWAELTTEEVFGLGERFRLEERLRRLNELGFDVGEIELVAYEDTFRLQLHSKVVDPGHHRRRLLALTGLLAQENQARRLLNDIAAFGAHLAQTGQTPVSETAVAARWLAEIFEPAIAAIPTELWSKRDAAELFHELLEHSWQLSEREQRDVALEEAVASYVDEVLRPAPDERSALLSDGP